MSRLWDLWSRRKKHLEDSSERLSASYTLSSYVGEGGFGKVYRCLNSEKVIFAAKTARIDLPSPQDVQLAQETIKLEARLIPLQQHLAATHPELASRLVLPLDTFTQNEKLWVVYPYVNTIHGEHVLASVEYAVKPKTPNELQRRLQELRVLAWTIDESARYHLFHLDLTPSSFFLARRFGGSNTKLFDFGLSAFGNSLETLLRISSADGYEFGRVEHISPERLWGRLKIGISSLDAFVRSEVFSLATIAYEAIAGIPLYTQNGFQAETETRSAVLAGGLPENREKALKNHLRELGFTRNAQERVVAIFQKTLSKDPQKRFASASAFISALQEALTLP